MQNPENSSSGSTPLPVLEQFNRSEVLDQEEAEQAEVSANLKHASRFHRRMQTAKRTLQTAVIATEINHFTNEGVRFGAFAVTMTETHNPMLAGIVLGGTTLVIEGAGALATASMLSAEQRGKLMDWALSKGEKVVPQGKKIPPAAEFGTAMIAGTPVLMGLKNAADPKRSFEQNRRHGIFTASWMASLFAAEGTVLGNSVEKYNDPKMLAGGAIAIGGLAMAIKFSKSLVNNKAFKYIPNKLMRRAEDSQVRRIINKRGLEVGRLTDETEVQQALKLEQEVWDEKHYGTLDVYKKYLPQSRIFATFENGEIVGVNRLFAGAPELPPFISEMPISDDALKQKLVEGCRELKVEEYGTAAVKDGYRNNKIFLDLCRLAYRDATERDIDSWGIIMEPRRVQLMNRSLGFTFEQIGPTIDYQGGECAAHLMRFEDVRKHMQASKPELYDWFVNQPLNH